MIEIHANRMKRPTTVHAWISLQFVDPLDHVGSILGRLVDVLLTIGFIVGSSVPGLAISAVRLSSSLALLFEITRRLLDSALRTCSRIIHSIARSLALNLIIAFATTQTLLVVHSKASPRSDYAREGISTEFAI